MTTPNDLAKPRVPAGSEKLIQEGAKSYVQATIAMNQFKEIVQGVCEKLALGRIDEINRILGTNLTEEDLHHWPHKGKPLNPDDPWLSMYFTLKDVGYIYLGLYWKSIQDGKYQLHAITAFEIWDQKLFEKARQKFHEKRDLKFNSFPYKDKNRYITLSEAISDEEATTFPEKVQSVLEGFLGGWEKIGGLKKLMEDQPKAQ